MQKLLSVVSPKAPANSSGLSAALAHLESSNIVQSSTNDGKAQTTAPDKLLIVSPYTSRPHLLDLTLLNHAQVLLAKGLTILTHPSGGNVCEFTQAIQDPTHYRTGGYSSPIAIS